jgi:hypothetical protein
LILFFSNHVLFLFLTYLMALSVAFPVPPFKLLSAPGFQRAEVLTPKEPSRHSPAFPWEFIKVSLAHDSFFLSGQWPPTVMAHASSASPFGGVNPSSSETLQLGTHIFGNYLLNLNLNKRAQSLDNREHSDLNV